MQQAEEPYPANQEPVNTGMPNPQNPQNMGNPQNMQGRGQQYANNGYQNPQNYAGGYYQPEDPQEPEVNPKLEKFMTIGSIVVGVLILAIFHGTGRKCDGLFDLGFWQAGSSKNRQRQRPQLRRHRSPVRSKCRASLAKQKQRQKKCWQILVLGLSMPEKNRPPIMTRVRSWLSSRQRARWLIKIRPFLTR